MPVRDKLFFKLRHALDILGKALDTDKIYLDSKLAQRFKRRHLSMRTSRGNRTKKYSDRYYEYRLDNFGYSNIFHNYYLTGQLHNSLKFYLEKRNVFYEASPIYLKYLIEGNLGGKVFPIVAEAWRYASKEIDILCENLSKIIINEYGRSLR